MENKNSLANSLLARFAGATVLITLATIGLWLIGYRTAAAILGTATGALYLLLIILITSHVTRRQTIETMQAGAEIALKAQQINDSWDTKKTASMTTLVREGIRLGATNSPRLPAPLPGEVSDWLQLPSPVEGDFEELDN